MRQTARRTSSRCRYRPGQPWPPSKIGGIGVEGDIELYGNIGEQHFYRKTEQGADINAAESAGIERRRPVSAVVLQLQMRRHGSLVGIFQRAGTHFQFGKPRAAVYRQNRVPLAAQNICAEHATRNGTGASLLK